ncbi:MAG: transposase, partial [Magnetococcales bacterium]|nr:transposase [Magnetococcales bacterium]
MFRPMDRQASLLESHLFMPDALREKLQRSWPEVFRTQVLKMIPEAAFAALYHAFQGRPNFPVAILVGLSILKEMLDLTDEALMDSFRFDLRFHYALRLDLEDTALSIRTLYNFRERVVGSPAVSATFEQVTDKIIAILGLNTGEQRLDSTHIRSNMANLTRLGLFVRTIEQFLARLQKSYPNLFEALPKILKERYGERPGHFGDVRSTQSQRRLNVVAKDLWSLVDRFRADADVNRMHAYKLLKRLLDEQCVVAKGEQEASVEAKDAAEVISQPQSPDEQQEADNHPVTGSVPVAVEEPKAVEHAQPHNPDEQQSANDHAYADDAPATPKQPKDVASNTLQSPSDPDATYSGHKGKGYQMQICETCHKDNPIQVITHSHVEPAHISDQKATIPIIDALVKRGLTPEKLFADTNYNSGQNMLDASRRGVQLMAPTPGQANPDMLKLLDFSVILEDFKITACPKGFQPVRDTLGADGLTHNLKFDRDQCAACDFSGMCPAGKQAGRLRVSPDDIALEFCIEISRDREATAAFKEAYKKRAGIESTNAEGKTAHGMEKFWTRERIKAFCVACRRKNLVGLNAGGVGNGPGTLIWNFQVVGGANG